MYNNVNMWLQHNNAPPHIALKLDSILISAIRTVLLVVGSACLAMPFSTRDIFLFLRKGLAVPEEIADKR
jgi:hypothetical protein